MSFSDLFDSGFKKRNNDHFAAIVRVAMDDGIISKEEREFLDRLALNLDINESDYKLILKDYKAHPINPPTSYNVRLERLYDLSRMVYADQIRGEQQVLLLRKIAIGLGYSSENVKYIVEKALTLVSNNVTIENFMNEIKMMNR